MEKIKNILLGSFTVIGICLVLYINIEPIIKSIIEDGIFVFVVKAAVFIGLFILVYSAAHSK